MESLEQTLDRLRKEYRRGSADRIAKLEQALSRLEQNLSDADALKELRRHFHSLAGTGSIFGFPRLSELGLRGERVCDALIAGKSAPTSSELNQWRELLEALRAEL